MDISLEDETSDTTQDQEAILKYMGINDCANDSTMSVVKPENVPHNNISPSAKASGFGQSPFDP